MTQPVLSTLPPPDDDHGDRPSWSPDHREALRAAFGEVCKIGNRDDKTGHFRVELKAPRALISASWSQEGSRLCLEKLDHTGTPLMNQPMAVSGPDEQGLSFTYAADLAPAVIIDILVRLQVIARLGGYLFDLSDWIRPKKAHLSLVPFFDVKRIKLPVLDMAKARAEQAIHQSPYLGMVYRTDLFGRLTICRQEDILYFENRERSLGDIAVPRGWWPASKLVQVCSLEDLLELEGKFEHLYQSRHGVH